MDVKWFTLVLLISFASTIAFLYLVDCTERAYLEEKYKFAAKKYRKIYVCLSYISLFFLAFSLAVTWNGPAIMMESTPEITVNSVTTSVAIDTTKDFEILREHVDDKEYYTVTGWGTETVTETYVHYPYLSFNSGEIDDDGFLYLPADKEFRFVPSDEIRFEVTEETAVYRPDNILKNLFYYKLDLTVYTLYAPEEVIRDVVMIKYH